jgi:hypothetical protein
MVDVARSVKLTGAFHCFKRAAIRAILGQEFISEVAVHMVSIERGPCMSTSTP